MFSIVEIVWDDGTKGLKTVLTEWIDFRTSEISMSDNYRKSIKKMENKNINWKKYRCQILLSKILKYKKARQKEKFFSYYSSQYQPKILKKNILPHSSKDNNNYQNSYLEFNKNLNINSTSPPPLIRILPPNTINNILNKKDSTSNDDINKHNDSNVDQDTNNPNMQKTITKSDINEIYNSINENVSSKFEILSKQYDNLSSKHDDLLVKVDNVISKQDIIYKKLEDIQALIVSQKQSSVFKTKIILDDKYETPEFPINDINILKEFDRRLMNSRSSDQMVVRLKKFIHSGSLNTSCKNIMEYLFHYDLIRQFSWTGQGGIHRDISKEIFNINHGIIELITKSVNYLRDDEFCFEEYKVKNAIKEFLKRSSFRAKKKNLLSNGNTPLLKEYSEYGHSIYEYKIKKHNHRSSSNDSKQRTNQDEMTQMNLENTITNINKLDDISMDSSNCGYSSSYSSDSSSYDSKSAISNSSSDNYFKTIKKIKKNH